MKILLNMLCCPKCKLALESKDNLTYCSNFKCSYGHSSFTTVDGKLVLVDYDNSIIQRDAFINSSAINMVERTIKFSKIQGFVKVILNGSSDVSKINLELCSELLNTTTNPKILIIGGGTIGAGCEEFIKQYQKDIIAFDVYDSENIDFIADAHSIPIIDEYFDLIIVQAVLEHVLLPDTVVSECNRILKKGGFIYSETPFLQHVHEGAYDFTRFTLLGHRILFKQFEVIKSGIIGGLGQSLLWSIEYFARGLFRSRKIGKIVKLSFFWVRLLEKLIPGAYNNDGACGCYFLGKKTMIPEVKLSSFIKEYKGAQK